MFTCDMEGMQKYMLLSPALPSQVCRCPLCRLTNVWIVLELTCRFKL